MASLSLKKTGRALRGKEGNYASSDHSAIYRSFSDLGLTLPPGLQISKGEREILTAVESRKLDPCIERCRRQRERVDTSIQDGHEPIAQGICSLERNEYEPLYPQAATGDPHAPRSPEPLRSSMERGSPMCGNESVANPALVGRSQAPYAQGSRSSSKYAVVSDNGMRCHEFGEIEDRHGSSDLHDLSYSRKKRRVENDGSLGLRPESVTTTLPFAFQGAGQSEHLKLSQRKMRSSNVPSRKYTLDLGYVSSHAPYSGRVKRIQRTTQADNISAVAFSSCQFTSESSCEDSCDTTHASVPRGRSSKLDSLETPHRISPLRRGDGSKLSQRDGGDSSPSAQHWRHVKLQSSQPTKHHRILGTPYPLGTSPDISTSLSSVEAATEADGRAVGVEADVSDVLISPSSPIKPSLESHVSRKHPNNLNVQQPNQFLQHFVHQHTDFTYPVPSNFYNHPSYISTLSIKNPSELRTRRSSSISLLRPSSSLAIRTAASKSRQRSNSMPNLTTISSEEAMNHPKTPQPFRLTEAQVNNQIQQTYAMQQPSSSFQSPPRAQTHLHGTANQHTYANGTNHAVNGAPHHSSNLDQETSHLAAMLACHLLKMSNQSAESPDHIAGYLQAFIVKLSELPVKRIHLHRTLGFLKSFPAAGSPPNTVPLDEDLLRARNKIKRLEAQITTIESQKTQSMVQFQQQHDALMASTKTIAQQQDFAAHQFHQIERLRRDALQWKDQAENFHRLLNNPPPRALSSDTLCNRMPPGNAPAGGFMPSSEQHVMATNTPSGPQGQSIQAVTPAIDHFEMDRRHSAFSSASSELVDLTTEHSTPATSAPSHTSSSLSPQSSSKQSIAAPGQSYYTGTRKPAWMASNLPPQHSLNLALYGPKKHTQDVIDVDPMQQPFVFNPSDEVLDAAEARKNNPSYASYQQKSRVTKNTKAPKLTKAQQRALENEHAPPPKKSKKVKKTRVWKPRETPEEKVARLADEKKTAEQDAVIQQQLFQETTMEREAREREEKDMAEKQAMMDAQEQREAEEKEAEDVAEMEAFLDANMPDGGDGSEEHINEVNDEQAAPETAHEIFHGSAQDTTIHNTTDTIQESNTGDNQEQAATVPEDDGLDALFEDDGAMDDEATLNFRAAATALLRPTEQPEATQDPNDLDAMLSTPCAADDLDSFMEGLSYDPNLPPLDPNDPIFAEDFWSTYQ